MTQPEEQTIEQIADEIAERARQLGDDHVPAIERVCNDVAVRMQAMGRQITAQRKAIADLLRHTAEFKRTCRGLHCRQELFFVRHFDTGELTPYSADGTNHYTTCIDRDQFHKRRNPNAR